MITDPRFAPRRPDLPFLVRRSRPKQQAAPPAEMKPAAASSAPKIDYRRPDREPPAAPPPPKATPPARSAPAASSDSLDLSAPAPGGQSSGAPAPKIDFSRPDRRPSAPAAAPAASGSLDLSAPSSPATTPPASGGIDYSRHGGGGAPASGSLDLSEPSSPPPRAAAPASSDSLDLSDPPAAAATPVAAPQRRPTQRVHEDVRVHGRSQYLMSVQDPTVTLTRMQSGIGNLSIEAVCSAEVGDLRLGAVYQLRSGGSLTVQHADGHRYAPPTSRRPVIVAAREEYERISLDLRQIRDIERIGIYAYSESRAQLTWNGTLVLTTYGGARIELPLETLYAGRIAMLMSLYNLDGELVVRAEMETIAGDVREAARAYGYERITWRDERAPVD